MRDFFISYTKSDENYATWVAELLEQNGYKVIIQAWDFLAGENFVERIQQSLVESDKLIVILSREYLTSKWCEAEWTAKLLTQVESNKRKIVPIRIEDFHVEGLLAPIVYIDAVEKSKNKVQAEILEGVKGEKARVSNGYRRKFALSKHSHGLGLIMTKLEETSRSSIALSIISMNLDCLLRPFFVPKIDFDIFKVQLFL